MENPAFNEQEMIDEVNMQDDPKDWAAEPDEE
jgi:hypothetical protein